LLLVIGSAAEDCLQRLMIGSAAEEQAPEAVEAGGLRRRWSSEEAGRRRRIDPGFSVHGDGRQDKYICGPIFLCLPSPIYQTIGDTKKIHLPKGLASCQMTNFSKQLKMLTSTNCIRPTRYV
jgi:hypothetical protein